MRHQLKLSDAVARKLNGIVKSMGGGVVQIGFMDGAVDDQGNSIPTIAYLNEFGHGGQFPAPPRPFFRTMIEKESPHWPGQMGHLAKVTNYNGPQVLGIMGQDIAKALEQSITELTEPALSPTTLILRKKFWSHPEDVRASDVVAAQQAVAAGEDGASGTQAKPLITFHSYMLHSVTSKVIP